MFYELRESSMPSSPCSFILPFTPLTKIAIVATASVSPEIEVKMLEKIIPEKFSVPVVFGSECYIPPKNAQEKAERFLSYCLDDSVSHLWSCRGGEGSADIIIYLEENLDKLRQAKPKMLIGFSDFTAILIFFSQKLSWPAVHGMGALQWVRKFPDDLTMSKTLDLVLNKKYPGVLNNLKALNQAGLKVQESKQIIQGELTGGNLTLLSIGIKDSWEIETAGKILFIEDWNEKGYQMQRALKYFYRIKKLENIKALIIGDLMAGRLDPDDFENKKQEEILWRLISVFAEEYLKKIPVFYTPRIGHGNANDPLVLGWDVRLEY